jgi:hypothetical protein
MFSGQNIRNAIKMYKKLEKLNFEIISTYQKIGL